MTSDSVRSEFTRLASMWREETTLLSSTTQIMGHAAYNSILDMGPVVVPLILAELEQKSGWWFDALQQLTVHRPHMRQEDAGRYQPMRAAWLAWGRATGHLPVDSAAEGVCP